MDTTLANRIVIAILGLWGSGFVYSATADDAQIRVPRTAGNSKLRPYLPGSWGQVEVEATNTSDRDATVLVSSFIRGNKYRQFARRFWVPANSRRTTFQPIFLPNDFDSQAKSIKIDSSVYFRTDAESKWHPLLDEADRVLHSTMIPFSTVQTYTAVIADLEIPRNSDAEFALDLIQGCAFLRYRNRHVAMLESDLPTTDATLDSFRNLVVCSNRIASDAAALRAVRRWVQRGGKLWIMVDLVSQETLEHLLGDACAIQEVDRTDLTETQVLSDKLREWGRDDVPERYDRPVKFVRVVAENVEITHTIQGWPAAFRQQMGHGQILFTTAGAKAWASRPTNEAELSAGLRLVPKTPMERLTSSWFTETTPSPIRIAAFEDSLKQQIGYQVVDRRIIILVLSAFGLGLLGAGWWLRRAQKSERMLWAGPGLAIIAAIALVALGAQSRHSAPDMTAFVQFVEAAEYSEEINIHGMMAVYRRDSAKTTIRSDRGGLPELDFALQPGTTRQMVWTDFDHWEWKDLEIPAGVHLSRYRDSAKLDAPLSATGQFGPAGLEGFIRTGPFLDASDGVFTTETRSVCGVELRSDGRFVSGPDQSLPRGVFLGGTILSDTQRARQDVFRKLWQTDGNVPVVQRPTLFIWTKPIETGFRISGEDESVGSALLSIPLQLERTPENTEVRIPAPFIPYQRILDPDGRSITSSFLNSSREWVEKSGPSRNWLRFQMPREVLPMALQQAVLRVHFVGQSEKLSVVAFVNRRIEVISSIEQPSGEMRLKIDRPELLKLDSEGGLIPGLFVGDTDRQSPSRSRGKLWQIDYVHIDIAGRTGAVP